MSDSIPTRSEIFTAMEEFQDLLYTVCVNDGIGELRQSLDGVFGAKEMREKRQTQYFEDRSAVYNFVTVDDERIVHEVAKELSREGYIEISNRIRRILNFVEEDISYSIDEFSNVHNHFDTVIGGGLGLASQDINDVGRFDSLARASSNGNMAKIKEVFDGWESDIKEEVEEYFSSVLDIAVANHRNMADILVSALLVEEGLMESSLISIGALINQTVAEIRGETPLTQDFSTIAGAAGDAAIFTLKSPKIATALTLVSFGAKAISEVSKAFDITIYAPISSSKYDEAMNDFEEILNRIEVGISSARNEAALEVEHYFEPIVKLKNLSDSRVSQVIPGLQYI